MMSNKDYISEFMESYSEISPTISLFKGTIKTMQAFGFSAAAAMILSEVSDLLPYLDCKDVPDYALSLIDSLSLPPKPEYGNEVTTACAFLFKAYCYKAKGDVYTTRQCLSTVLSIPDSLVVYGRKSLKEIKEYADQFEKKLNKV